MTAHRVGTLLMRLGCWTLGIMFACGAAAAMATAVIECLKHGIAQGSAMLVVVIALLAICAGGILRRDTWGVPR